MNRTYLIAALIVVLVAAAAVSVVQTNRKESDQNSGEQGPGTRNGSAGKRVVRTAWTPAEAQEALQGFLVPDFELSGAPSMAELEAMARRLTKEDLASLIEGLSFEESEGVEGWVRSALFAEWGRRDPEAAMKHMEQFPISGEPNYAIEQAWFSLFRGWAENSPGDAYEALTAMGNSAERPGGLAYRQATKVIFRELARKDATGAWELVQASEGGLANEDAVAGFFAGLHDRGDAQQFVAEWNAALWDTDEARKAHAVYERQREASGSTIVETPREEQIATRIATAWAQHDLDGAVTWLMENGPGNEHYRSWRASQVMRDWALANPSAALGKIGEQGDQNQQVLLGYGAIMGDPSLASAVIGKFDDYATRASIMTTVLVLGDQHAEDRHFPGSDFTARPPDHGARYEYLLEAIEAGQFPEQKNREFLRRLNESFRELVPEAAQAWEAMSNQ